MLKLGISINLRYFFQDVDFERMFKDIQSFQSKKFYLGNKFCVLKFINLSSNKI